MRSDSQLDERRLFGCGELFFLLRSHRAIGRSENTNLKFFPVSHEHCRLREMQEKRKLAWQLCSAIAIVCTSAIVCNFSPSPVESVLSREKTLHRNARKGVEVYDAATSSVINKKCLKSYVNFFLFENLLAPFPRFEGPRCIIESSRFANITSKIIFSELLTVTHQIASKAKRSQWKRK